MAATLDKAVAKRIVRDAGLPTAPFWSAERFEDVAGTPIPLPAFVKPLAEGTGKGCDGRSRVGSRTELRSEIRRLAAKRSEEHTSELQSLMRISYAVFCLKKKN